MMNRPVFAVATECDDDSTVITLFLFGHAVPCRFVGSHHHQTAVEWMNRWNEHFDKAWTGVREVAACMMHEFMVALREVGVRQETIDKAIKKMEDNVEK